MYVTVTEEHLRKAVKAGTVNSSTRNSIVRALREAGFIISGTSSYTAFFVGDEFCDLEGRALVFSILSRVYHNYHTPSILKALRSLLPFKIRIPKSISVKK